MTETVQLSREQQRTEAASPGLDEEVPCLAAALSAANALEAVQGTHSLIPSTF